MKTTARRRHCELAFTNENPRTVSLMAIVSLLITGPGFILPATHAATSPPGAFTVYSSGRKTVGREVSVERSKRTAMPLELSRLSVDLKTDCARNTNEDYCQPKRSNENGAGAFVRNILVRTRTTIAMIVLFLVFFSETILSTPATAKSFPFEAITTISHTDGQVANFPTLLSSSTAISPSAPYTGPLIDVSNSVMVQLDSGVTYRDLREGTGRGVKEKDRVNIQWVLKRSNGYSIDASSNNDGVPFIFAVGSTDGNQRAITGLDQGIRGMKVGGIRRIVIPPSLAYVDGLEETSPGPIPVGFGPKQRVRRVMENRMDVPDETFLLDIKLTRIQ